MPETHPMGHRLAFVLFLVLVVVNVLVALIVCQASGFPAIDGSGLGRSPATLARSGFALVVLRVFVVLLFGAVLTWSLADSRQTFFVVLAAAATILGAAYALQWHSSLAVFLLLVGVMTMLSLLLCPRPADLAGFLMSFLFILSVQSGILYFFGKLLELGYVQQLLQFKVIGIVFDVRFLFGSLFLIFALVRAVHMAMQERWPDVDDLWAAEVAAPITTDSAMGMMFAPVNWFVFILLSTLRLTVNWFWLFAAKTWLGLQHISQAFAREIGALLADLGIWRAILKPMLSFLLLLGYFRLVDHSVPEIAFYLRQDAFLAFPWSAMGSILRLFLASAGLAALAGVIWTETPWHDLAARTASFAVALIMSFALAGFALATLLSKLMDTPVVGFAHLGPLASAMAAIIAMVLLANIGRRLVPAGTSGGAGPATVMAWAERLGAAARRVWETIGRYVRASPWISTGMLLALVVLTVLLLRSPTRAAPPAMVAAGPRADPGRVQPMAPMLRSEPQDLRDDQVAAILRQHAFFDAKQNPAGRFRNDLAPNADGTLSDRATGILWQQGGSAAYVTYAEAERLVADLNERAFAGHRDWRLPTLEEAASLLEPDRQNEDLHIDKQFDPRQRRIWTADAAGPNGAWRVDFAEGSLFWTAKDFRHFVRACRAGASPLP